MSRETFANAQPRLAILDAFDRMASEILCVPAMEATNDHELAIAKMVDQISAEGRLDPMIIPEVTAMLDFMMSRSDSEFLVRYIKWRMATQSAK